jgi:co-chaperonin GroES (HSP10)
MQVVNAIGNTVLLKQLNLEETTHSGFILSSKTQSPIYEIKSIGDIAKKENLFKVGDKVLIRNTIGSDIYVDNAIIYKSVKWWEIDAIVND